MMCLVKVTHLDLDLYLLKQGFIYSHSIAVVLKRLLEENVGLLNVAFLLLDQASQVKDHTVVSRKNRNELSKITLAFGSFTKIK